MSHDFALEQLEAAVRYLATGREPVRSRLAKAYAESLSRVDPAKDLPPALRSRFEELRKSLTHLGKFPAEPWSAAIGMDETEAVRLASLVVELATELRSRLHQ